MKKSKKVIVILVTVAIIIAVLYFLQKLLVPKYVDGIVEGALVAEYYQEENKDFDVTDH